MQWVIFDKMNKSYVNVNFIQHKEKKTSKAILVIDMPKNCYECDFLDDDGDYPMCKITTEVCG